MGPGLLSLELGFYLMGYGEPREVHEEEIVAGSRWKGVLEDGCVQFAEGDQA